MIYVLENLSKRFQVRNSKLHLSQSMWIKVCVPTSRNIRQIESGRWGRKKGDLLHGTGIPALGEKRETEVKCTLPGTKGLSLELNLEILCVPWNKISCWELTFYMPEGIRLARMCACQGLIQRRPGWMLERCHLCLL